MNEFARTVAPITDPYVVVDDFLPVELAEAMRADIDAHFGDPDKHKATTHQVWNYWFVPGLYTYLRTDPEKVIEKAKVERFVGELGELSMSRLGLRAVTWPYLSLYVDGCQQQWHNDAHNGRLGFVYSLTRPVRQTQGGGTLLMAEGNVFRSFLDVPTTVHGFCDSIEPKFNRLLLFDDRLIHAVERLDGSMDPLEGRFVLHGHLQDGGPMLNGPLDFEKLQPVLRAALEPFVRAQGEEMKKFHGPLSVHLTIRWDGALSDLRVLYDRVTHVAPQHAGGWENLRRQFLSALAAARYPASDGATTLTLPVVFPGLTGSPENVLQAIRAPAA